LGSVWRARIHIECGCFHCHLFGAQP
jgi:hypothetical protein